MSTPAQLTKMPTRCARKEVPDLCGLTPTVASSPANA